jgi:hypothetical protein
MILSSHGWYHFGGKLQEIFGKNFCKGHGASGILRKSPWQAHPVRKIPGKFEAMLSSHGRHHSGRKLQEVWLEFLGET